MSAINLLTLMVGGGGTFTPPPAPSGAVFLEDGRYFTLANGPNEWAAIKFGSLTLGKVLGRSIAMN